MSLLSPLFLLGLGALALPIIVHLVRRTRSPQVDFASLMFVRQIPQRTIRRKRLHNLLLLVLRALAIMLLVLAFARPFFRGSEVEALQRDRFTLLLIDNSLSMRYGKRFEQAKTAAASTLDQLGSNDRSALVSFARSFQVHTRFTTDTAKVRELLKDLKPSYEGTDFSQALKGVEGLLQEAGKGEKRVFLISDFQAAGKAPDADQIHLPADVKLVSLDVGEPDAPNLAVSEVGVHSVVYQQKYSDKVTARISNYGETEQDTVRVEFRINDHVVEKREVKVPPRDSQTVEFTDFNLTEGLNRCTIEINDPAFDPDNRCNFAIRRAAQLKALIIETAGRGQSESFYLKNALTTGENLPFAVTTKTAGSTNPGELSDYAVIILNDAGDLNTALATQLVKYVEAGGGLIISTGPHTRAEEFNKLLGAVSPAVLEAQQVLRNDFVAMSEIRTDHPIFEVFRQSGRLAATRVFGYFRSTPAEKSSVLARFEDGSPALVESSRGSGKVLLFTSTLDSAWNDLPLTPIYLPLIRQTVRHLGEREEKASYVVGQAFTVPVAKDGTPPAVDTPTGARITEKQQTTLGDLLINPTEPGFYRLRYSGLSEYAAVNLDSKESDLKKLNVEEFVRALTGADPAASQATGKSPARVTNEEVESRQRVWWLMLITALLLFVAEAVLSRRMRTAKIIH
jgi:hypothetical protein